MPRPGPRPYECVRRAWHSDRHQPIRGSLIQQIFRVVNEAHASATKKNKEWQEKLPIVVLKAEEIMYSKANSEAEYTNPDTLWDRVNDAINTIIRREENTETGDLLPPCVEAALNLGCIPIRASRSQRHSNPRTYLTPRPQEPPIPANRVPDSPNDERRPPLFRPTHSGSQLNFARTNPSGNSPNLRSETNNHTAPHGLVGRGQLPLTDANASPSLGSAYPLYYGTQFRTHRVTETGSSETIYVGTPVIPSAGAAGDFARPDSRGAECDLSLRLGMLSRPFGRGETDDGPSGSQPANREFRFFPGIIAGEPFETGSRTWNSGVEGSSLEATVRRGKEPFSRNNEDGQFCWQPGRPSHNWFNN